MREGISGADGRRCEPASGIALLFRYGHRCHLEIASLALAAFLHPVHLAAQSPGDCLKYRNHGQTEQARACFQRLTAESNSYARAEGYWGLENYQEANRQFREAVAASPRTTLYRVRWGRLFLERFNKAEAAKLFQEVLQAEPANPQALLGLAMVSAESFESKAVEFAKRAAEADPQLAEAREFLARLALEDNNPEEAARQADLALKTSQEALDALAIHAAIDWLGDKDGSPWIDRIQRINPVYGEGFATVAYFLVLNRRYEEGVAFYRKAVALSPELWSAHSELGVNLMRLGLEQEARKELELCYENAYRNAATVNSLRLLDSYKNFRTVQAQGAVIKLHKKEADLLKPYFEDELDRIILTYNQKYKFHLVKQVQIEVYPDHEDFAVRTMGMPGLGALGVTFGYMVAMDSPSARKPGSFHWGSTLWHEMSHVYVLAATKHRVPRWFTEGMAVYEETAVSPDWGDRMTPEVIEAIAKKKLLPVAELDRGFIRPSYPAQVVISYYQAGKICEYIAKTWNYGKLLEMMQAYAALKPTPEVIQAALGLKPEEFDKRFLLWLDTETKKTVDSFPEWTKKYEPVAKAAAEKRYDDVIRQGLEIRDLYREFVEPGCVYEMLADAYMAKGDRKSALAELERYAKIGGRDPLTIKKLAGLLEEAGRPADGAAALSKLNYIYPNDEELHRQLGDLYTEANNASGAIREYQAVLAMNPHDQAASHFNLARAYRKAEKIDEAREQLFLALEAAPGYRPAQKMLLELTGKAN